MTNPREPLPDEELESAVQRSAQLLERGSMPPEVLLRALTLSVQQILAQRAPQQPSILDQILSQQQPAAYPAQQQGYPPQPPLPFYGPPGKSRPPGVPDPSSFGDQNF